MKWITLRIRDKVKESAEIYPVEVEIDGKVRKGKIPVADVENQKDLVQDPGAGADVNWAGLTPLGMSRSRTRNLPCGCTSLSSAVIWTRPGREKSCRS